MVENQQKPNENKEEKSKKKAGRIIKKVLLYVAFALVLALFFFMGYFTRSCQNGKEISKIDEMLLYIQDVGYLIDDRTGERIELDGEKINKIISTYYLDKYSEYLNKQEYETLIENGKGNYDGVGVSFFGGSTTIGVITGNSPAYKAGLKAGDVIESGEQDGVKELTAFSTATEVINFMKACTEDKPVILYVTREGEFTGKRFSLYKGKYVCSYVEYQDGEKTAIFSGEKNQKPEFTVIDGGMENLPQDTAYIRLAVFEGDAVKQFEKAFLYMKERNKTKLILDLRNNGGGYISVFSEISEYLIVNGAEDLLMKFQTKDDTGNYTKKGDKFNENVTDVYVLANENTASASECLIGAMLCYDGEIFNESKLIIEKNGEGVAKTYGKGIMQTTFELLSGGALKITTAKLFWPDGRCIHGKGIIATGDNAVEKGSAVERAISLINGN